MCKSLQNEHHIYCHCNVYMRGGGGGGGGGNPHQDTCNQHLSIEKWITAHEVLKVPPYLKCYTGVYINSKNIHNSYTCMSVKISAK